MNPTTIGLVWQCAAMSQLPLFECNISNNDLNIILIAKDTNFKLFSTYKQIYYFTASSNVPS